MTIMIGIDPHKASHTAVAIDNTECVLDELRVRACVTDRAAAVVGVTVPGSGVGNRVRSRSGLPPRPAARCCWRDRRGRASGAVDADPVVGIRSGTEERPE